MVKIRRQPNRVGSAETRAAHLRLQRVTGLILAGCLSGMLAGCHSAKLPDKSSPQYREIVSAFYVGLAALQVGDDVHAETKLSEVTQLVPGEPAGMGQLGSAGVAPAKLRCSFRRDWNGRASLRPKTTRCTTCWEFSRANAAIPRKPLPTCAKRPNSIRRI